MSRFYTTRNDMAEATRKDVVQLLNECLASVSHLVLQAKQAHWNVKGPSFVGLHALFQDTYKQATEWADELAERAVQLGGVAEGTLQIVSERTKLQGYPLDASAGLDHASALAGSMGRFSAMVREAIDRAESQGDAGTGDLFTEISREADKMLWMLEAHLQAER